MKIQRGSAKIIALTSFILLGCCVSADHEGSDDPLDWLRDSIPGEPGVDYPILADVEPTSFSCRDRVFGGKSEYPFIFLFHFNYTLTRTH